jgi:long-subunit fatty acid transport protein
MQGWNSNLGFIFSPIEQVNLAGVFKTAFTGKVDLAKTRTDYYTDPSTGVPTGTTQNAASRDDVRIDFPWSLGVGVSWRPRSALTFSADYTKTNWSEATIRNYFVLLATPLSTPDQPPPPVVFTAPLPYPYLGLESQNDTEEIRMGVEYVFIRGRLKIPLRAGYFNNKQIDTFNLEAPPRFNGFTVGTGIILGRVVLDVAYLYEYGRFSHDEVTNTVRNQRFFASLIYRFGHP